MKETYSQSAFEEPRKPSSGKRVNACLPSQLRKKKSAKLKEARSERTACTGVRRTPSATPKPNSPTVIDSTGRRHALPSTRHHTSGPPRGAPGGGETRTDTRGHAARRHPLWGITTLTLYGIWQTSSSTRLLAAAPPSPRSRRSDAERVPCGVRATTASCRAPGGHTSARRARLSCKSTLQLSKNEGGNVGFLLQWWPKPTTGPSWRRARRARPRCARSSRSTTSTAQVRTRALTARGFFFAGARVC